MDKITEDQKEKIYGELMNLIIDGLDKGVIFKEDAQDAAEFILARMEKVDTEKDLILFLDDLARKWDVFLPEFHLVKKNELINKVQQELQEIQ